MAIEVIKDEDDQRQFDATKIDGLDPAYHYRWVRKDPTNIVRKEISGYEVVERTPELSHIVSDRTRMKKSEDATTAVEWGDMILMRTPMENWDKRQARERAKILRQTKGVAAAYKAAIDRMARSEEGGPVAFEEHRDTSSAYKETVSEKEFVKQMEDSPEDEGPRIGRKR